MINNKEEYYNFIRLLANYFEEDDFYNYFLSELGSGKNGLKIYRSEKIKNIDLLWVDYIEGCIISLDTIVRNPRKFIAREEEIVPIALSKNTTTESIKHLAQHTYLISEVTEDHITPNKILNIQKEESFDIYENRFIYTLLLKLKDFLDKRLALIKDSMLDNDVVNVSLESNFVLNDKKIDCTINLRTKAKKEDLEFSSTGELNDLQRVARLAKIVDEFCLSDFAHKLRNCALVRPPITRTNVILKNPDFKKALSLWGFIETYDKVGFDVVTKESLEDLSKDSFDVIAKNIYLNYLFYKNMIELNETEDKVIRKTKYSPKFVQKFIEEVVRSGEIDDIEYRRTFLETMKNKERYTSKQIKDVNDAIDKALEEDEIYIHEKELEKERIRLEKEKEKERIRLEKEKERLRLAKIKAKEKEKKRIKEEKEKERLAKAKEKEKQRLKEQTERKKQLEKEKLAKEKAKEKERIAKEKAKEKEKERLAKEKEKERERIRLEKEKEKERIRLEKEKEKERIRLEKETEEKEELIVPVSYTDTKGKIKNKFKK